MLVRLYAELNEYIAPGKRGLAWHQSLSGAATVADLLAASSIPEQEVDLVLVNGSSTGFNHRLNESDRVSVYPVFESFNIATVTQVRSKPLRSVRFIVDDTLEELADLLGKLGFDVTLGATPHVITLSIREQRVLLTTNAAIVAERTLTHARLLKSTDPLDQLREVSRRLDLSS